jgi:H+-translocating NAD(P) transhydrogenase subunit alpha
MTIGVLHEPAPETRVSLLPEHVAVLCKAGHKVVVQNEAGLKSFAFDAAYKAAGARMASRMEVMQLSEIILGIHLQHEKDWQNKVFIGDYRALFAADKMNQLAGQHATVFSLDMLPRTTRAQAMDILSSQANIAGYKAVLLAAQMLPRYFPMFMTAAGTIPPSRVVIIGAGVAGLQAIATAKRLGAIVEVSDTRPAVKEEVQSLGGKFIEVEGAADASKAGGYAVEQTDEFKERQRERLAESIAKADVVICTAAIPGRKAPVIITREMIRSMKPGSVIVDLAASTGGNTELTENNQTVIHHFVSIIGDSHLYSTAPADASKMFGKNILNFLELITAKDGTLNLNFEDDLVQGACITHGGRVVNERVASLLNKE